MAAEEVNLAFSVLGLRERLIVKLAILAGMRPGEIFGLRHGRVTDNVADVREDNAKTVRDGYLRN